VHPDAGPFEPIEPLTEACEWVSLTTSPTVIEVGSTLDVGDFGPYSASPGDSFIVLTAGTLGGEFSTVNFQDRQN
jgi:hypothetical protein